MNVNYEALWEEVKGQGNVNPLWRPDDVEKAKFALSQPYTFVQTYFEKADNSPDAVTTPAVLFFTMKALQACDFTATRDMLLRFLRVFESKLGIEVFDDHIVVYTSSRFAYEQELVYTFPQFKWLFVSPCRFYSSDDNRVVMSAMAQKREKEAQGVFRDFQQRGSGLTIKSVQCDSYDLSLKIEAVADPGLKDIYKALECVRSALGWLDYFSCMFVLVTVGDIRYNCSAFSPWRATTSGGVEAVNYCRLFGLFGNARVLRFFCSYFFHIYDATPGSFPTIELRQEQTPQVELELARYVADRLKESGFSGTLILRTKRQEWVINWPINVLGFNTIYNRLKVTAMLDSPQMSAVSDWSLNAVAAATTMTALLEALNQCMTGVAQDTSYEDHLALWVSRFQDCCPYVPESVSLNYLDLLEAYVLYVSPQDEVLSLIAGWRKTIKTRGVAYL